MIEPELAAVSEQHAYPAHHGYALGGGILSKHAYAARLRLEHARQELECGGFARAVGAGIGAHLALFQGEGYAAKRVNAHLFPADKAHGPGLIEILYYVFKLHQGSISIFIHTNSPFRQLRWPMER